MLLVKSILRDCVGVQQRGWVWSDLSHSSFGRISSHSNKVSKYQILLSFKDVVKRRHIPTHQFEVVTVESHIMMIRYKRAHFPKSSDRDRDVPLKYPASVHLTISPGKGLGGSRRLPPTSWLFTFDGSFDQSRRGILHLPALVMPGMVLEE